MRYYKEHDINQFEFLLEFDLYESDEPEILDIIEYYMKLRPDMIEWRNLSMKSFTIDIMEQNIDKVHWKEFSKLPEAIDVIEKNIGKVDWSALSSNPSAIPILEKNQDRINWNNFSLNDGIYEELCHDNYEIYIPDNIFL